MYGAGKHDHVNLVRMRATLFNMLTRVLTRTP